MSKKHKTPEGETIGEMVADARHAFNWSQARLAEELGQHIGRYVPRTYIGQLEAGFISQPGSDIMEALEARLGISRESLLRASGWLGGASADGAILAELRRIVALPTLEARMLAARRLPREYQAAIEALAVDLLLSRATQR